MNKEHKTERFYFDTNIWLDIAEKRGHRSEIAKALARKIILENSLIFYSHAVIMELRNIGYTQNGIYEIFNFAKPDNLRKLHITKEQTREAKKLAKRRDLPFCDTLYAILSRDYDAQLISRDKDFEKLKDITRACPPEDLL